MIRGALILAAVKGGDEGLAKLTVVSPDGRPVIDVAAPAATTLGVRQLRFESPEPGDFGSLKSMASCVQAGRINWASAP